MRANRDQKITTKSFTSTRSSDYAAIGGGSNGIGSGSQLSRWLARGLPLGGKEEEDKDSTPIAFDVDFCNGGKVEVNGECKGNGNSNGPVDNNNNDDYNIDNDNNDNNGGGAGQRRKHGKIVEEREEMEGEEEKREEAECVTFLSRKSKLGMNKLICLSISIPNWRRWQNTPINGAHALQSWVMKVPVLLSQST